MATEFLQGMQLGSTMAARAQDMRANALNMSQRLMQMDYQREAFPLELQQLEQQANISSKLMDSQTRGVSEMGDYLKTHDPNSPDFMGGMIEIAGKYPYLADTSAFKLATAAVEKKWTNEIGLLNANARILAAENAKLSLQGRLDQMAERNELLRDALQIKRDQIATPKPTLSQRTEELYQQAKEELDQATAAYQALPDADPNKANAQKRVQQAMDAVQRYAPKQGINITTTTPEGVTTQVSTGAAVPGTAGPVTGNIQSGLQARGIQTMVAAKEAPFAAAMQVLTDLEKSVTPSQIGIPGALQEAYSGTIGQVPGLNLVPKQTLYNRDMIENLRSMVRAFQPSGRESESARREALNALPSTGAFKNYDQFSAAVAATRKFIGLQAQSYAEQIGQSTLVGQSKEQLLQGYRDYEQSVNALIKTGRVTPDQGLRMLQREALRRNEAAARFLP